MSFSTIKSEEPLSAAQVVEIRAQYVRGSGDAGLGAMAIKYGVSQMQISRIVNRTRRKNV